MKVVLKETFAELLTNYTDHTGLTNELWDEIEQHYSEPGRYYHTPEHLENLLTQLTTVKAEVKNWHTVLFSLYYHDIIYNAQRGDNEERSAELAVKRMEQIAVPMEMISRCKSQILATKSHLLSADSDTNYFTDADLSILGQEWEVYSSYCNAVRKEYAVYPDLVYKPGRKKVIRHFLGMERIYKSDYFYSKFEIQAKQNLEKELGMF